MFWVMTHTPIPPRLHVPLCLSGRPHGIERAKSIVVAVRSFLRFLGASGRCLPGMEHAIPGFASRQLSSVPRFLTAEDIERVIDSCAGQAFELRDRAVLLLLAQLALRASEVAQLKFSDIDWRNGGIRVCGKGRRQEYRTGKKTTDRVRLPARGCHRLMD